MEVTVTFRHLGCGDLANVRDCGSERPRRIPGLIYRASSKKGGFYCKDNWSQTGVASCVQPSATNAVIVHSRERAT
jgi:hypothetical protein